MQNYENESKIHFTESKNYFTRSLFYFSLSCACENQVVTNSDLLVKNCRYKLTLKERNKEIPFLIKSVLLLFVSLHQVG
jgi:hypothetical protein